MNLKPGAPPSYIFAVRNIVPQLLGESAKEKSIAELRKYLEEGVKAGKITVAQKDEILEFAKKEDQAGLQEKLTAIAGQEVKVSIQPPEELTDYLNTYSPGSQSGKLNAGLEGTDKENLDEPQDTVE